MTIFLIKFFITVLCVIILSEIAKRIHPNVAGILMGLPLGSAISSYFFAYEHGVDFTMQTVPWGIAGLASTVVFSLAYLWMGRLSAKTHRLAQVSLTGAVSLLAWGGFALLLHQIPVNLPVALLILAVVIFLNLRILKSFGTSGGKTSEKASSLGVILFRALVAGTSISLVTGFARVIGSSWSGLVSAFPVMMFPLMIVLQFEDGQQAYPGVIHSYAYSITNLIMFYLGIYFLLPRVGINVTYLILYPVSGLYLWRLGRFRSRG
jgi:uncharacterized membrane protein (GlpM family)